MSNPWFRLYSEFASDPKVQSMDEVMQRRLVMLFCLRCSNVLETLQEHEIAFALRISETDMKQMKQIFVSKRFIDEKWNILNWNKRQFVSDTSTDRVRKWRKKNETFPKRSKAVTETIQKQPDTDSEQIQIQNRIRYKRTPVVQFKKPSLIEVRAYCLSRKNSVDAESFLDFYESKGWKIGKNPMKDWQAAIRTWERNERSNGNGSEPDPDKAEAEYFRSLEQYGIKPR